MAIYVESDIASNRCSKSRGSEREMIDCCTDTIISKDDVIREIHPLPLGEGAKREPDRAKPQEEGEGSGGVKLFSLWNT